MTYRGYYIDRELHSGYYKCNLWLTDNTVGEYMQTVTADTLQGMKKLIDSYPNLVEA